LGRSGLRVSAIGLGTSTWGTRTDREDAAEQLKTFLNAGGNLLDTADVYGDAESVIGDLLGGVVAREDVLIATKAGGVIVDGKPSANATREHLTKCLERSLRRLGTDHVDLWQLHAWDPVTPLEETLSVVDEAVATGKVRYAGVCNYTSKEAALIAGSGLVTSVQVEYSLLERRIERNLVPCAQEHALAILPWAPLGRGVLTGKYLNGLPEKQGRFFSWYVKPFVNDRTARITTAVAEVAADLGVPPAAVALAWVRDRPAVASALVGARTIDQLTESLAAYGLVLPDDARQSLDLA
jgi:aryl-alcohol dehydrogenase-like predicted oxidoreductase